MEELFYEPFYQLMRLRLLADRMVKEQELGVSDAKVVVVVPEGNTAYREVITSPPLKARFPNCETVSGIFRSTLKRPDDAYGIVCPFRRLLGRYEKLSLTERAFDEGQAKRLATL